MSVIKQNLSLKSIIYLRVALEEFLQKYENLLDNKNKYELTEIILKTKRIQLAAYLNRHEKTILDIAIEYLKEIDNNEHKEPTLFRANRKITKR